MTTSVIESIWVQFRTHWRFSVYFPVRSHFTSLQGTYYFLLLLSNGCMPKMLWTRFICYTSCWSFFRSHTSAPVLLIVMSLRISLTTYYYPTNFVTWCSTLLRQHQHVLLEIIPFTCMHISFSVFCCFVVHKFLFCDINTIIVGKWSLIVH